jgi:hypothetical protein
MTTLFLRELKEIMCKNNCHSAKAPQNKIALVIALISEE